MRTPVAIDDLGLQERRYAFQNLRTGGEPDQRILRQFIAVGPGQFSKLQSVLESGGQDGQFSFARYREWLDRRSEFYLPNDREAEVPPDLPQEPMQAMRRPAEGYESPQVFRSAAPNEPVGVPRRQVAIPSANGMLEIGDDDSDPPAVLRDLERRSR